MGTRLLPVLKLETYSKCPKKFEYSLRSGDPPRLLGPKAALLKQIVSDAHLRFTRNQETTAWRSVTAAIDKSIFSELPHRDDPNYDDLIDAFLKKSFRYMEMVRKGWYDPVYMKEELQGFPDLSVTVPMHLAQVHDDIDLVLFDEKDLIVCRFGSIEEHAGTLYNDLRFRAQALLVSKRLGKPVTKLRSLVWTEDTERVSVTDLFIHDQEEFMGKTEGALNQILSGIRAGVFYPSVNEQCKSCPYNRICSF